VSGIIRRDVLIGSAALACGAVIGRAAAQEVKSTGVGKIALGRAAKKAQAFLERFGAPGLSLAYARDGRIRYAGAFGVADPRDHTALRTNHRFRIASVSKPITSVAVWRLIENRMLTAEQKVFGTGGVLPQYEIKRAPRRDWLEMITIDHLLTHTGGGWTNDVDDPMFHYPGQRQEDLIQQTLETAPLKTRPGEAYAYSNFGYCVLGRIIEAATQRSYESVVRELVLSPSGAETMSIAGDTLEERKPDEVYYHDPDGWAYKMNVARMDSHGGWIATAGELVSFVLHADGYKTVPDLISRDTMRRMIARSKASAYYARGWSINPRHNNRWHNGALPGTASLLVRVEGGGHFAGLVNTRVRNPDINDALDALLWSIYDEVNG